MTHSSSHGAGLGAETVTALHVEVLCVHELWIKLVFLQISNKRWECNRRVWKKKNLFFYLWSSEKFINTVFPPTPYNKTQFKVNIKCFRCLIIVLEGISVRNAVKGKQLSASKSSGSDRAALWSPDVSATSVRHRFYWVDRKCLRLVSQSLDFWRRK